MVEVLFAVVGLVMVATPAMAADARVDAALRAYNDLEHEKVLQLLAPALAGELSPRDRAAALRLGGCAHMVLGDRDAALASFRQSFALDADAALEPQLASPDARALFELARGQWRAELIPLMEARAADIERLHVDVDSPKSAAGATTLDIRVTLQDPARMVAQVEMSYKRRGQSSFTTLTRRPAPSLAFQLPPEVTETEAPFTLEYHVTLRHETGFDLRRVGDADHPRIVAIRPGHRPRWHEEWWVRGVLAAAVVSAGVGGYLAYRAVDVGPQRVVVGE